MKWKAVVLTGFALVALGGVAKAAGVIGGHKDPGADVVAEKTQHLEERFEAAIEPAEVSARLGSKGPKGARGPRGFRGPKGLQGAKGATGATGATGPTGPKGTFGSVTSFASAPAFLCAFESGACAVGSVKVECPPGTTLTGGGYTGAGIITTVTWSAPVGNAWGIIAVNLDEVPVTNLKAVAECASQ